MIRTSMRVLLMRRRKTFSVDSKTGTLAAFEKEYSEMGTEGHRVNNSGGKKKCHVIIVAKSSFRNGYLIQCAVFYRTQKNSKTQYGFLCPRKMSRMHGASPPLK